MSGKPKVLLINPPETAYPASIGLFVGLPLGLMYIAAVLDKKGIPVEILDTLVTGVEKVKEGDATYCGMRPEKIKEEINLRKPGILGINAATTPHIDNAIMVAKLAKGVDPKILTVAGGNHSTVLYRELLGGNPEIDVVVRGEGEYAMLEIAEKWDGTAKSLRGIKGIAYRENGKIVEAEPRPVIENLDELPFPAYHLVDMEAYFDPKKKAELWGGGEHLRDIPMITSRGCPYSCTFCSIHLHMTRKWRAHSAEYVLRHIQHVIGKYGVEHIHMDDDNLVLDTKRMHAILDGIMQRSLKFTWDTPNGVRADRLDRELLVKMKKTGCELLIISPESGDQWVLDNIVKKNLDLKKVEEAARLCKEVGIKVGALFIIGFPGETKENIKHTIDFALMLTRRYDVQWRGIIIATPMFGTEMYEICKQKGYLAGPVTPRTLSEAMYANGKPLIRTEHFTPEEITGIALDANRRGNRLHAQKYMRHPLLALSLLVKSPYKAKTFVMKTLRGYS